MGGTLAKCRDFLSLSQSHADQHRILSFSPHNDVQRLLTAGVLPDTMKGLCASQLGWIDLQLLSWGFGDTPGLQKVVRHCLGVKMDKRLQTSDWNRRPLSQEQIQYAALDAACLLDVW